MLFLLFELGQDDYAIHSAEIAAVIPMVHAKRLPEAPLSILGLIQYYGATVPVVDVAALALGRPAHARTSTRIVLVRYRDEFAPGRLLGLLVERATSVFRCDAAAFETSAVASPGARYLGPVAAGPRGLVQWLNVEELLTPALSHLLFPEAGHGA